MSYRAAIRIPALFQVNCGVPLPPDNTGYTPSGSTFRHD